MSADLTKYLLERPQYGDRKNPIETAVARELIELTNRIAREVIAENPDIGQRVRSMVLQVVTAALIADGDLNLYVVQAVAKALATRALHVKRMEREDAESDD